MNNVTFPFRIELLSLSNEAIWLTLPWSILVLGVLLGLFTCVLPGKWAKWGTLFVCIGSLVAAFIAGLGRLDHAPTMLFNNMLISDPYAHFMSLLYMGSAAFTILASIDYLERERLQHGEYYLLVLLSSIGMILMTSALDLIVFFIGLELMSLCVYTLVAFRRSDRKANEASLKYFILGGAASAVLLYGVSMIYGATGSTQIQTILAVAQSFGATAPLLFTAGAWLVIAGFLFKVASVPFHAWMPDVYEGAPAPVTGYMTTGLKAASFAAFVRVFMSLGYGKGLSEVVQHSLHDILWICAALTMLIGNLVALSQTQLKRMLAYSSIAHTGYLLMGVMVGAFSPDGYTSVLIYLVSYSVMNLGAFVILSMISGRGDTGLTLYDLSGLSSKNPWLAFAMTVFMLSMAGIPPTAGFVAKYFLFYSAVQVGEVPLVVLGVLCSAVSVYYYLRVILYMYMRDPVTGVTEVSKKFSVWGTFAVACMLVLTLQVGLLPASWVEAAKHALTGL